MQLSSLIFVGVLSIGVDTKSVLEKNPIPKVVSLLEELQTKIEADGKAEEKSYNKFACWCEDTLAGKAKDIADAKQQILDLQASITKLSSDIAVHKVEVKQLEKDIAINLESQREATAVREKEHEAYVAETTESEQCIGALEAAINVLHGAGQGKFLETIQQAQLLNVADGVRGVLRAPVWKRTMKPEDLQLVRNFVETPEDFLKGSSGFLQLPSHNPFGDYAPQSTQIQGILKGMYDTFAKDLEKANSEEAAKRKSFEELMVIKKQELATNQANLAREKKAEAEKTKQEAEDKVTLRDTEQQLADDEKFFENAKKSCQEKASAWAGRTGLRTEELHGIARAIAILSDEDATKTFENATSTFLQLAQQRDITPHGPLTKAYDHVKSIATKYKSVKLARIAAKIQSGGHFNAVINAIDNMIKTLHEEQLEDEKERDFCTDKQNKNKFAMEDIDHDIKHSEDTITRLDDELTALETRQTTLETEVNATKDSIAEMKGMRADEEKAFIQSVKDDMDAIELIQQAIDALNGFYAKNKPGASFIAKKTAPADDKYEPMPDTSFQSGNYAGRHQEGTGIIAILGMIKEDLENEIKAARKENGASGTNYASDLAALEETLAALEKTLYEVQVQMADREYKKQDHETSKKQSEDDLAGEKETEEALKKKCDWVQTHFESRKEKRKTEIDGLIDAKNYLAGLDE